MNGLFIRIALSTYMCMYYGYEFQSCRSHAGVEQPISRRCYRSWLLTPSDIEMPIMLERNRSGASIISYMTVDLPILRMIDPIRDTVTILRNCRSAKVSIRSETVTRTQMYLKNIELIQQEFSLEKNNCSRTTTGEN